MSDASSRESKGLKSAYEKALERMEQEGIDPPRGAAFDEKSLSAIAEERSKAKAKLAELEILHTKSIAGTFDPEQRRQEEADYQAERSRIEDRRDRRIAEIRDSADAG